MSDAAWPRLKVSETEREDLEESEKVQHWVERLCQTRLEQISCVENESPEVRMRRVLPRLVVNCLCLEGQFTSAQKSQRTCGLRDSLCHPVTYFTIITKLVS